MVERKVKKRTSPKRTRKTSPKRTRKTSPKRTRKTSPKRTRKTSPRRKRKTRSKRLNPSPVRGIYNRILNRINGGDRQTGYLDPGVISGRTEAYEARVAAEAARDELVERKAQDLSVIYHNEFLSNYSIDVIYARSKTAQKVLLNQFHNKMLTRISEEQVTEQPIAGFSLRESNRAKVAGLNMVIDMIKEQYRL